MSRCNRPSPDVYSSREAAEITGVPWRTVSYWSQTGTVKPLIPCAGTGTDQWFDYTGLLVLFIIGQVGSGVSLEQKCEISKLIASHLAATANVLKFTLGDFVVLVIDLAGARKQLAARIASTILVRHTQGARQ